MSKEFDAAKAAFDADLANPETRMNREQIAEIVKTVTDPKEQVAFIKYILGRAAAISQTETDVDLRKVTEFFDALHDEPNSGANMSAERFDEIAGGLSRSEKLYCAKLMLQQRARDQARESRGEGSPLDATGVRPEAIKTYVKGLSTILKTRKAPTRAEYEDITSHLNDAEKAAIQALQLESNGGKPLPFRDDSKLH
jgi:hypothetical protein